MPPHMRYVGRKNPGVFGLRVAKPPEHSLVDAVLTQY